MRRKLVAGKLEDERRASPPMRACSIAWRPSGPVPDRRTLAVCVPSPYLAQTQAALTGSAVRWGAQDVSEHRSGAYTGEVAAAMLAEFGCRYAIVGHSERRQIAWRDGRRGRRQGARRAGCGADPDRVRRRDARRARARRDRRGRRAAARGGDRRARRAMSRESSSPTSRSGRSAPAGRPRRRRRRRCTRLLRAQLAAARSRET